MVGEKRLRYIGHLKLRNWTFSQCGSVPGDVNSGGKVNALDIIKVISYY